MPMKRQKRSAVNSSLEGLKAHFGEGAYSRWAAQRPQNHSPEFCL